MIRIEQVSHHYGVRPVLRDVSLVVERGELLAVMGPNGMGKSTLMGIAAGVIAPTRGKVWIDGKARRSSEEAERAIRQKTVWLPAEPWLPTGKTGREYLLAVGRIWGVPWERLMEHVERLLALFDLEEQGDSGISSYSTGQKKKIALAGALVTECEVMILDEPFSGGLDPSGILALKRVLLHRVREAGRTVMLATPVPELVEELASRVAIISEGKLTALDTVAALRSRVAGTGVGEAMRFDEVYERMVNPKSAEKVATYFGGAL